MSITAITIENFKSIREPVRIEFKPITLLFGPNSAGKSTIVQALHYAREIFDRENVDPGQTILGGKSIDLGGFRNLVHNQNMSLPIKLTFDLDLSREDLPFYQDGIEEIGTTRLEMAESGYLVDVATRVTTAQVKIAIRWSEQTSKAFISSYAVNTNGSELLEIESSPDGLQINISKIDPFNPIFFNNADPEEAKKSLAKFLLAPQNGESESEDIWADIALGDFGDIFPILFQFMKLDQGIPGLTVPINIEGQKSALPNWGRNLSIDRTIWADDLEMEDRPNFLRLLSSLSVGPGEIVWNELRKFCYLGPLRQVPSRNHEPEKSPDEARWANGLAAWDLLYNAEEGFISKVNRWLTHQERLNAGYSVEVKKYKELDLSSDLMLALIQGRYNDEELDLKRELLDIPPKRRLLLRVEDNNMEVLPQDVGVGISQVLPVIVAALAAKTGFVAIEQPELHIHPAFQVALGDLFIEQVREHPDLNFILETHSEHLLLRILRRIRATYRGNNEGVPITHNDVAVLFVTPGKSGSRVTTIPITEDGDFETEWPEGFFEEREQELFD